MKRRLSIDPPPELERLGRSLRALLDRLLMVGESNPELASDLSWAKETLDEVAARLARHALPGRTPLMGLPGEPGDARRYHVGALLSHHHPMRPELEFEQERRVTRGRVRFGIAFEGPPGCVHGGFVAFFFDQILGHHNIVAGVGAYTGTLSVRYHRTTPLLKELAFDAEIAERDGRKVRTRGRLLDGQTLVAEAEGLFILAQQPLRPA